MRIIFKLLFFATPGTGPCLLHLKKISMCAGNVGEDVCLIGFFQSGFYKIGTNKTK